MPIIQVLFSSYKEMTKMKIYRLYSPGNEQGRLRMRSPGTKTTCDGSES